MSIKTNSHVLTANMSSLVSFKKFEGKEYLVAPAVLITEGVHNNIYYPDMELKKYPDSWNGRPVVLGHPVNEDGTPVTANSPGVLEKQGLGMLFNTKFDSKSKKLKSEIWIDKEKCKNVSPDTMRKLKDNETIEVSTGLFTDDEILNNEENWNGESYKMIAKNHRPDHLALLPDGKGSCSWSDGAGMPRINEDNNNKQEVSDGLQEGQEKEVVNKEITDNKEGDVTAGGEFVGGFDGCVLHMQKTKGLSKDSASKLCAYIGRKAGKINEEDIAILKETAEEMQLKYNEEKKESQVLSVREPDNTNPQTNSQEVNVERKEKIDKLVTNKMVDEKDRAGLEAISDVLFEKVEKSFEAPAKAVVVETPAPIVVNEAKTIEEYIEKAPVAFKDTLSEGMKLNSEKRGKMIDSLKANKANEYTEDELKSKSTSELEKLSKLARVEIDYSASAGASPKTNAETDEIPAMPKMEFKK